MPISNLYSKSQKILRGEVPGDYIYDEIPYPLRVQIVQIWENTFIPLSLYKSFVETLRHEYGQFHLVKDFLHDRYYPDDYHFDDDHYRKEFFNFFLTEKDTERVIDTIQISFRAIDATQRDFRKTERDGYSKQDNSAISELNYRFKEHGVGYQFENGEIMRVDSEYVHSEVIKPALSILSCKTYQGTQDEFLRAHEHYRKGNMKEAITEASKAFESTIKTIFDKRGWPLPTKPTTTVLVDACLDKELIPKYWHSNLNHLAGLLKGSSTARNNESAHGQGTTAREVPLHVAAYALHMTASAIIFLVSCEEERPQ